MSTGTGEAASEPGANRGEREVVAIVGGDGPIASAVHARLAADPQVAGVVEVRSPGEGVILPEGTTAVLLLGGRHDRGVDGTANHPDVRVADATLSAAASAGVRHLVVLSSALVYGAWPNNAVPLTEDATVRPRPGLTYALVLAEIERLVGEWREANPSATVAVLRPTVTVPTHGRDASWLRESPWFPMRWQSGDVGPPRQYVGDSDLVAAIAHACRQHLDGPFNVAPEGWISAEALPELAGPPPPIRVPPALAEALTAAKLRRHGYPAAIAAHLHEPWVIASDRLRATGWDPVDTNEEAFVGASAGSPFAEMDARRRQLLAFGAALGGLAIVVAAVVAIVRRRGRGSRGGGG